MYSTSVMDSVAPISMTSSDYSAYGVPIKSLCHGGQTLPAFPSRSSPLRRRCLTTSTLSCRTLPSRWARLPRRQRPAKAAPPPRARPWRAPRRCSRSRCTDTCELGLPVDTCTPKLNFNYRPWKKKNWLYNQGKSYLCCSDVNLCVCCSDFKCCFRWVQSHESTRIPYCKIKSFYILNIQNLCVRSSGLTADKFQALRSASCFNRTWQVLVVL